MFDLKGWIKLSEFLQSLKHSLDREFYWFWDKDELYSEALSKLPYLAEHWDSKFNIPFEVYAFKYCKQAAKKYIDRSYINRKVYLSEILDEQITLEMTSISDEDPLDFIKSNFVLDFCSYFEEGYEEILYKSYTEDFIKDFLDTKASSSKDLFRLYVEGLLSGEPIKEMAERLNCTVQNLYHVRKELKDFYKQSWGKF